MQIKKPFALVGCILLLLAAVLFVHLATTTEDYSRYNIQWNGTSVLFERAGDLGAVTITDLDDLDAYPHSRLLLIAPGAAFDDEAIARYRDYVEVGSTLILADDFGTGNQLLAGIGSTIRIQDGNLSSMDAEYSNPHTVLAYRSANSTLTEGVEIVVMNRPASLTGGEILLETSILSFVDANGDLHIDADETLGKHAVAAYERIGGGDLFVIADPSLFINGMLTLGSVRDNQRFVQNILKSNETLLIDQMSSETTAGSAVTDLLAAVKSTTIIKIILICTVLLLVAYAFRRNIL